MSNSQILTVAQMRAAEMALVDAGSSESELMERAGQACADWIWRIAAGRAVTVLCGPGNNGGDGYVIARVLAERGLPVQVIAPMPVKAVAASAAAKLYSGEIATSGSQINDGVFVDCLFGSGLSRDLKAEHALLLRDLAERHAFSVAVDVPSGVESDTGALLGDGLPNYDLTLALGAWKPAHFRLPVRAQMGALKLVPIGIEAVEGAAQLIARPAIPVPPTDTHKYTRGLACVIAGGMPGAVLLASEAAQRAGAGYVKLLGKLGNRSAAPSLVTSGKPLAEALSDKRISAVLIGPGLGRDEVAQERLASALGQSSRVVLDADALHIVRPEMLADGGDYLATPHDGELEALCKAFGVVAPDRQSRALALAQTSGMVVLAKGPETLIASPDGRVAIAPPASSWLSVAGSGDVLAGIAVSRMACGLNAFEAAQEAVWLHGEAARLAGRAITADDLAAHVSAAMGAAQ